MCLPVDALQVRDALRMEQLSGRVADEDNVAVAVRCVSGYGEY